VSSGSLGALLRKLFPNHTTFTVIGPVWESNNYGGGIPILLPSEESSTKATTLLSSPPLLVIRLGPGFFVVEVVFWQWIHVSVGGSCPLVVEWVDVGHKMAFPGGTKVGEGGKMKDDR